MAKELNRFEHYKLLKRLTQFDPAIDDLSEEEFFALTEYQQDYILTVSQNYLDYQIVPEDIHKLSDIASCKNVFLNMVLPLTPK